METVLFLVVQSLVKSGAVDKDKFLNHYKEGVAHFKDELNWSAKEMAAMLSFENTLDHNL